MVPGHSPDGREQDGRAPGQFVMPLKTWASKHGMGSIESLLSYLIILLQKIMH